MSDDEAAAILDSIPHAPQCQNYIAESLCSCGKRLVSEWILDHGCQSSED
jgi:hypothetical protein